MVGDFMDMSSNVKAFCARRFRLPALFCLALCVNRMATADTAAFTMADVLDFPFISGIVSADHQDRIGWVQNWRGVRNLWIADGPRFAPRAVTRFSEDDGQELAHLGFSPDGTQLVYVRGGDHDANWPAAGNLAPDATSQPEQPFATIWSLSVTNGVPVKVAVGDSPAISVRGELAYVKDGQVWTAKLDGSGKPERMFFDRGRDGTLRWSPDGSRLAFVSDRGDHSFVGIFTSKDRPVLYLAPSTSFDDVPCWSPDGKMIAFVRSPGKGGPPQPILKQTPHPWAIWVADASKDEGHVVWQSPNTLEGSYPETSGEANLHWASGDHSGDRLVFLADLDNWPHLYSIPTAGGQPLLLTPGAFMVEDVAESRDHHFLIYSANTGTSPGDDDRRHLFRVPVDRAEPLALTTGESLDTSPVVASDNSIGFISADPTHPTSLQLMSLANGVRRPVSPTELPADFPVDRLVIPKPVTFRAADGVNVHGQLFQRDDGTASKPGVIFAHGGPARQMLLGWHDKDVYSNHYAVNQYLATHGFVVLSVNYRSGIGYGHAFEYPERGGYAGAAEYQDVLAAAHLLQAMPGVDPRRIGMWGSSYGGYLTALALARNSDTFKAGVDIYGVSDWSTFIVHDLDSPDLRFETGDRKQAMKVAWLSSPVAAIPHWRSPVLLVHGDDDRNVPFQQMVDLVQRLETQHVPHEEIVFPNETHDFSLHRSWLRTDEAVARFLKEHLYDPAP
jgi:dipeptidyl aminopeptidase/acylaminoacyl peptidase